MERTLAIIKPDAVEHRHAGRILARIEEEGFRLVALRMAHLTRRDVEGFYSVHRERPFFDDLTAFMSSGPCIILVLEAEHAISRWRDIMGATNPADADPGTIRADFAASIEENVVHGSDGPDTARDEIAFFFSDDQLCPRTRQG